jgi:hypothetical protein
VKSRYRHEPPLDLRAPLPAGIAGERPAPKEPRKPLHAPGCWCSECWNAGLIYGEYLKARRLETL